MKRREFIQYSAQLGTLLSANMFLNFAKAEVSKKKYFVMIFLPGGWDTSLFSDPWIGEKNPDASEYFIEYGQDQLHSFQEKFRVGPALVPLTGYFSEMTLVNGVFLSPNDNGHESSVRYGQTGDGEGKLTHFSGNILKQLKNSPFGSGVNQSLHIGDYAPAVFNLSSVAQSKSFGDLADLVQWDQSPTDVSVALKKFKLYTDQIRKMNADLIEHSKNKYLKQHEVLALSFLNSLSASGYIELDRNQIFLDTHQDHEKRHLSSLVKGFEMIKQIFDSFKTFPSVSQPGKSLFDETTFMITSDFCRTPALNTSKGKDHNPQNNSILLVGAGLQKGVFGKSHLISRQKSSLGIPFLAASPLSIESEIPLLKKSGTFIVRPENIFASLAKSMDLNPSVLGTSIGEARILKSLLKS